MFKCGTFSGYRERRASTRGKTRRRWTRGERRSSATNIEKGFAILASPEGDSSLFRTYGPALCLTPLRNKEQHSVEERLCLFFSMCIRILVLVSLGLREKTTDGLSCQLIARPAVSAAVRGFLLILHLHFYLCFTISYAFLVIAYLCKRHISCVFSTSEEETRPSKCNVIPNDGFSFLLDLIFIRNPP